MDLYLRIANELYLKRLIVGGFDGVYEFAKAFRNEGMDRTHNPEFTMVELYVAYKDYYWMMEMTESLLEKVANEVNGSTLINLNDKEINFKAPFKRISILDSIKEHTGIDISKMDDNQLFETAKNLGIEVDNTMGKGKLIDEIFGEKCEHNYIQPTFIIDYPKEMSPLTNEHREKPKLTERFELLVNGKELANAYSELNDPIDQLSRFEDQLQLSEKGDDEAMFIDNDFIKALEYGMPPTSGIGIGIQAKGTAVIHHKSRLPHNNLELFSNAPITKLKHYETMGYNAARYCLKELPDPVIVATKGEALGARFHAKVALIYAIETSMTKDNAAPELLDFTFLKAKS